MACKRLAYLQGAYAAFTESDNADDSLDDKSSSDGFKLPEEVASELEEENVVSVKTVTTSMGISKHGSEKES